MKKFLVITFGVIVMLGLTVSAQALIIDINVGTQYGLSAGAGQGRAIGFQANQNFNLNSFGLYGVLSDRDYEVILYSSTDGKSPTSILGSWTDSVTSAGETWYDITTDYDIISNNYYILNWQGFDYNDKALFYYDSVFPTNFGAITAIDGISGPGANSFGNILYARSRLSFEPSNTTVPEPATMLLFGTGLIGAFVRKRRMA